MTDHEAKARELITLGWHVEGLTEHVTFDQEELVSAIVSALREAEAGEREACARIINTLANCKAIRCDIDADGKRSTAEFAKNAVAAIRSRSETDE